MKFKVGDKVSCVWFGYVSSNTRVRGNLDIFYTELKGKDCIVLEVEKSHIVFSYVGDYGVQVRTSSSSCRFELIEDCQPVKLTHCSTSKMQNLFNKRKEMYAMPVL